MIDESFTVHYKKWGVLISCPIGIQELCTLTKFFKKHYKYDLLDTAIGEKFKSICLTNKQGSENWREELGIISKDKKGET